MPDEPPSGDPADTDSAAPVWLFALNIAYVVVLVALGLAYVHIHRLHEFLPNPAGPIPLGVPWWGALGGVMISLTGVFRHATGWDRSYEYWHIARPVLGAVVGTVGYLIFVVVIRATGTTPSTSSASSAAAFDLVAFLVGYREELFRQLLKRATDVLLAPGSSQGKDSGK